MEFAVFRAGVDFRRKVLEQSAVVFAPREGPGEALGVQARDGGLKARLHHPAGKIAGILKPKWPDALEAGPFQFCFPIFAAILEEKVAEDNSGDAFLPGPPQGRGHGGFISLIGAWVRNGNFDQREPQRTRLGFQQFLPHPVHGDPVEVPGDRREEPDDFQPGIEPCLVKRPGAVFSAGPGDDCFLWSHAAIVTGKRACLDPWREKLVSPAFFGLS